ncbi:MAG: L-serine ammonia-lyase [Chlamydiae bacterium]|jgi:L-serine dehydratase|nr:L-serine ammonia-lyase [Chlamydiota bacterium]
MFVSTLDLFSIGIGPSSSHTVGPMRAAKRFLEDVLKKGKFEKISQLKIDLFGSLAMTGIGHGTNKAIFLGLNGKMPESCDPEFVEPFVEELERKKKLSLLDQLEIGFDPNVDLVFHYGKRLPYHSNGIRFFAYDKMGKCLHKEVIYSVGGGFIVLKDEFKNKVQKDEKIETVPFPFSSFKELKKHAVENGLQIYEIMMINEKAIREESIIKDQIFKIWGVMQSSVNRGCIKEGILPGGLEVKRRAPALFKKLKNFPSKDPLEVMDWVSLFALAVNEENAAGSQVVTAPTNGASGVIPAVLHYYVKFINTHEKEKIIEFFLTAAAIGALYKHGASLSAAEMGCQGEVGVASSMAAGALAAVLGGSLAQIENAAEIAMEHHLGMTCDPVAGLVQIPCIERNTMGAIKAINAARLAMMGEGDYKVTLDNVIESMRQIGVDMNAKYKETSIGGLATQVSVKTPEC